MQPNRTGIYASQISGHLYDGPYGAYDSLATVTLSASASSITFAGIPSGYKHLQVRMISRTNLAALGFASLTMKFNGDAGSSYSWHRMWGNGSSANAGATAPDTSMLFAVTSANSNTANEFSTAVVDVLDYASVNKNKTIRSLTGGDDNTGGANGYIGLHSGLWMNTSAVSSILIEPGAGQSFLAYSQFALFGVK
jgi:hypothetical protein